MSTNIHPRCARRPSRSPVLAAVAGACIAVPALADAVGDAGGSATINLTSVGAGPLTFSSDPNFRRAHAMAYADHTDTTGSTLTQSNTTTVATAAAFEPSSAQVSGVSASLPGFSVGVGQAHSFAHRIPDSAAWADGLAEIEILFSLVSGGPATPFNLLLNVSGAGSLSGNSLADENWTANYQFYMEIYDIDASGTPVLYSTSRFNQLGGPGPASATDAISITDTVTGLLPNHNYALYAYFDAESSAVAPAPGTAALAAVAGVLTGRRRRR